MAEWREGEREGGRKGGREGGREGKEVQCQCMHALNDHRWYNTTHIANGTQWKHSSMIALTTASTSITVQSKPRSTTALK